MLVSTVAFADLRTSIVRDMSIHQLIPTPTSQATTGERSWPPTPSATLGVGWQPLASGRVRDRARRWRRGEFDCAGRIGMDSLIEVFAGGVIVWLFTGGSPRLRDQAERRAQQVIAIFRFSCSPATLPSNRCATLVVGRDHPSASGSARPGSLSRHRRCRYSPAPSAASAANSAPAPPRVRASRT